MKAQALTKAARRAWTLARTAAVLLFAAAAAYGLWALLDWQLDPGAVSTAPNAPTRFEQREDFWTLYFFVIAGVVALLGVWFTWRRVAAAEQTAAAAESNVRVAQEGQITERFTRAIEQLGRKELEVRLGAIYALERIARDSERDHWPVMEILTAYVRERSPWKDDAPPKKDPKPTTDIQAVLTVIGRRKEEHREREEQRRLNLQNVDLRGADLGSAHLERALLDEAHLEDARLGRAHLERASLFRAHLEGALLFRAHLEGALLVAAHLEGAWLVGALPEHADLTAATGLTVAQVNTAYLDAKTRLPDYLPKEQITGRKTGA